MLPPIELLNSLSEVDCARTMGLLFEGSPGFASRLAALRPFDSYVHLVRVAEGLASSLPKEDQLELIDGHPRIGAKASTVSDMSYREQGYDREPATARLQGRLDALNAEYEARFGFRFVVFVAGRPRHEIADLMESRMSAGREEELGRALSDVFAIARDRLVKLTKVPEEVG